MSSERLAPLIHALTLNTVLGELIAPALSALETKSRENCGWFRSINMADFITLGVLRHLKSITTLRAIVQELGHVVDDVEQPPVARSTWSDAMASKRRQRVLHEVRLALLGAVMRCCPDRLSNITALGVRAVYAIDGSYQHESAHFGRKTKAEGGKDSAKGHCLLSIYDVRIGCVADVVVETRSRHEVPVMKDYDATDGALTRVERALWLVDRAFIDATYWDRKRKRGITMITRMKSNLSIDSTEYRPVSKQSCNRGVKSDQQITLKSSKCLWRLITYTSRRGRQVEFLTNDFSLEPGEIAFMYSRRWDEEKAFDVWKNDLAMAKAWGKTKASITNQVLLAVITQLLLALFLTKYDCEDDKKSREKQEARQAGKDGGTDRPQWTEAIYRHTSRLSRQVLRFFEFCYGKTASPQLYERQLRPLLLGYI